jgi:ATP-dependent helicase HepA
MAASQVDIADSIRIGTKVQIIGADSFGFGEISSLPDDRGEVEVRFYSAPLSFATMRVRPQQLRRDQSLPQQTRCYHVLDGVSLTGRVIGVEDAKNSVRRYYVQFPKQEYRWLEETAFHARSNRDDGDPVETLAGLAQESPFLFEARHRWVSAHVGQVRGCRGLTGLLSARIDLLPHQAEVVRRVLQDPVFRYLLADEVGLGKTIEAGIILRQFRLDWPQARVGVFVPEVLRQQWRGELTERFGLGDVPVWGHEDLATLPLPALDAAVIDEAHRVVVTAQSGAEQHRLAAATAKLARATRHLLLLSATPVLRHEEELLALLHLLAPDDYDPADLANFRRRLQLRGEVGRVLLALPTLTRPRYIMQQIDTLSTLLPADGVVLAARERAHRLADAGEEEALRTTAQELRVHLTESYRVHRRMLRTRRRFLRELADRAGEPLPKRDATPPAYENDPRLPQLWAILDDWRTQAVAEAADCPPEECHGAQEAYFLLAHLLVTDRTRLACEAEARLADPTTPPGEHQSLQRLAELARKPNPSGGRVADLARLLNRLQTESLRSKHVVFCGDTSACKQTVKVLTQLAPELGLAVAHSGLGVDGIENAVSRFRLEPQCRFLLADASLEEGRNLQTARGLVCFDLPWDPMRLEQRLGRLDRLDRGEGDVPCAVLLTHPDSDLALDTAWYTVLRDGFGLFSESLADLQLLVQAEMEGLRAAAFEGGPGALIRSAAGVKERVASEREALDEQDVIDGLYLGDLTTTPLWQSLEKAESREAVRNFGEQLAGYWNDILGLRVARDRQNGWVSTYSARFRQLPLLPVERLLPFRGLVEQPATVNRGTAVGHSDLLFLRPGHAFVDHVRTLSDWEDRGRAFAMWRRAPGFTIPRFIFRASVLSGLELPRLVEHLGQTDLDQPGRAALLRLVSGWFPSRLDEVFLDETGAEAEPELVRLCQERYSDADDINLSGRQARILPSLLGAPIWPRVCRESAGESLKAIKHSRAFAEDLHRAVDAAVEHFRTTLARLQVRSERATEMPAALDRAMLQEKVLQELVLELVANPLLRIDALGVYMLSDVFPTEACALGGPVAERQEGGEL